MMRIRLKTTLRATKANLVHPDLKDPQAQQDHLEKEECLEIQARPDTTVAMEKEDHLDLLDLKAHEECLENLDQSDQPEQREKQAHLDRKEIKD